jgi:ABC-2 type transport system ATP-binding protein
MIKTENLTKVYNGKKAVDNLNLEIAEGDVFGFFINDIEVARNPLKVKEIIGYLPEDVGFYGNMTAEQNLDYFARFYAMDANEREKRIKELLMLVKLNGVSQKVGGYSRGMNQRIGLAKALLNDPKVLFLDEPTANLDPEGVFQYRELIERLSDEGKTIFASSHILSEVSKVCNTTGIISKGRLIANGTLEEESKSDIRDYISSCLFEKGVKVKEMRMEEPTLEDVFLSVYRR